jgi:uncharacterized membrane protein required for colicin V production
MNFATIVFGALVFFFVWRGYQKGFIGSITRIVSWLIAYPAAIYLTKPVAELIVKHSPLDGMIVYFIAGSAIFLIVSIGVGKLLTLFSATISDTTQIENSSKIGGAIVGCVVGGILGLLAVYAIDLTQKPAAVTSKNTTAEESLYIPRNQNTTNNSDAAKTSGVDNFIDASAKKLVSNVAATAVDLTLHDATTTHLTRAFAENPQSMLGHIQQLSNDGQIQALLGDSDFQELLTKGDTNALMGNEGFQSLMNNADMQAILENVGDDKTGKTSQQLTAEKMVAAWGRTNDLKNDPRVITIVTDPEFQQQINSTNKLPLLTNPKLKMLTEIIFSSPTTTNDTTEVNRMAQQNNILLESGITQYEINDISNAHKNVQQPLSSDNAKPEKKPDPKIFRWTDENGKVHYSDNATKQ